MKRFLLEVTEEQLQLIADCVEDECRFMSGQMDLFNATAILNNCSEVRDKLDELKPFVTPHLPHNASYSWNGGHCPNKSQRKFIAQTYGIYREIRHRLAEENCDPNVWSVYLSETLTCKDSTPLPIINVIETRD